MGKTATKTKKVTRRATKTSVAYKPVVFQRIIIVTTCLVLAVVASAFIDRHNVNQAVAGTSIARGLYAQSTITLPVVGHAVKYNVYYKQTSEKEFNNAVRNIPANVPTYTISYLKKDTSYEYRVTAIDATGKEIYFSDTQPLLNLQSM